MTKATYIKWVQGNDNKDLQDYLLRRPAAWALISLIARRARRQPGLDIDSGLRLDAGEALIGDYVTIGLTEQKYRTAKKQLKATGQVTFRATTKGTIAKLVKSDIYDLNLAAGNDQANGQNNERPTNGQRTANEQTTTNQEGKEGKEGEEGTEPPPGQGGDYAFNKEESEYLNLVRQYGDIHDFEAIKRTKREQWQEQGGLSGKDRRQLHCWRQLRSEQSEQDRGRRNKTDWAGDMSAIGGG